MSGSRAARTLAKNEQRVVDLVRYWLSTGESYTAEVVVDQLRAGHVPAANCRRVLALLRADGALSAADVRAARRLLAGAPQRRKPQGPRLYVLARMVDGAVDLVYGSLAPTKPLCWTLGTLAYSGEIDDGWNALRHLRRAGYRAVPAHVEVTI